MWPAAATIVTDINCHRVICSGNYFNLKKKKQNSFGQFWTAHILNISLGVCWVLPKRWSCSFNDKNLHSPQSHNSHLFDRYCNSHLQVMGVLPKKERKKRHDSLESLALNITVPSLALKTPNGLDHLPPSPPSSLPSLLSLDPFGLCGGEALTQPETLLPKKPPQGRQNSNPKQRLVREAEPVRPSPLPPTTGRPAPHPPQPMSVQQKQLVPPTSAPIMSSSVGLQQGICKSGPPPTHMSSASSSHKQEPVHRPAPVRKLATSTPVPPLSNTSTTSLRHLPMTPGRLMHLQRAIEEQSTKRSDLYPHFGKSLTKPRPISLQNELSECEKGNIHVIWPLCTILNQVWAWFPCICVKRGCYCFCCQYYDGSV